jgi:hypothetical protein
MELINQIWSRDLHHKLSNPSKLYNNAFPDEGSFEQERQGNTSIKLKEIEN